MMLVSSSYILYFLSLFISTITISSIPSSTVELLKNLWKTSSDVGHVWSFPMPCPPFETRYDAIQEHLEALLEWVSCSLVCQALINALDYRFHSLPLPRDLLQVC